ncbi:class I SAM-dependent methyltransferase [Sphingomonas oryzagri]
MPDLRNPPLNAHYEGAYSDRMLRWRALGAIDKAGNLQELLGKHASEIHDVLEVGCGTGAVSLEVARLGIGHRHTGIDMADPVKHPHPGVREAGIVLQATDGAAIPFPDKSFDLVFSSHVLEHVTDERGFLAELTRVTRRWLYIEVPCELNLRTNIQGLQSTLNIGHINAYTPESLSLTLWTAGLRPVDIQAFDHSMAVHAFDTGRVKANAKAALRRTLLRLNPRLASKIFTYHVGALCEIVDPNQTLS